MLKGQRMSTLLEEKPVELLDENGWITLLQSIKSRRCTPILGPELCFGSHERRAALAKEWAGQEFLFRDSHDLSRVAQFVAIKHQPTYAKYSFPERLQRIPVPDFTDSEEPHRILASLPFSMYVTTNHDDYLVAALNNRIQQDKKPRREISRWNGLTDPSPSFDESFRADVANPIVFHLFGHADAPDSLVLTEDDYLDFLMMREQEEKIVPTQVASAFKLHSLLLLGYRFSDLDFRVLLRILNFYRSKQSISKHVSLQFVAERDSPEQANEKVSQVQKLLGAYCSDYHHVKVCWCTSRQFLSELQRRWKEYSRE